MISIIKMNILNEKIYFLYKFIFVFALSFSSLFAQKKQEFPIESVPNIYFYKTISPGFVLKQREKIATEVFNIRNPKEAELIITNQGFLYFERNYKYSKNYWKHKQEIKNREEAEMILRKHVAGFDKKMQAILSVDSTSPVAVSYFRWEQFKLERLNPRIGQPGSWEAYLNVELPSIKKVDIPTREKSGVAGEYIRIEFTKHEINQLQYKHLPVVGYDSTRLIQEDKNGKKMINPVLYRRITPTELLPYYSSGGRLIPAIDNQEEIVLYTNTIYDLPAPKIFGNPESFIQVLGGHGSDYKQGMPGLVNMQMNLSYLIVAGKNQGRLQPEMIQANQIQSLLDRTIQNDFKDLVLTSVPKPGKELFFSSLGVQGKLHASSYYRLSLTPSVNAFSSPMANFLEAFSSTGYPSKYCIFLCFNPDWGDTESISAQLAQYAHHRNLVLDSEFRDTEKPIAEISLKDAIYDISSFCHHRAVSLCLLHLIEERIEIYKNTHLVVGNYFFSVSESDDWFKGRLNEYGILLFPDMLAALQDGPSGMTILDIQSEMDFRRFFEISRVVSVVMEASLFTKADFDYKHENKIIKPYHICQIFGTAPVVIFNSALGAESHNEITCGILQAISGIDSFREKHLIKSISVKDCFYNWLY